MGETHPTPAENTDPASLLVEGREVDPAVLEGDIDSRMAALLKDHKEMGARPAKEPVTADLFPPDLPLSQNKAPKAPKAAAEPAAPEKATKKAAKKSKSTERTDRPVDTSSVPATRP